MDGLKAEWTGRLEVLTVHIASNAGRDLSRIYGSQATPTFIFLDENGKEIWRSIGRLDSERVKESLVGQ